MLPTRLQVLKLHLFFKDEAGRGNRHVKPGEITGKVEKVVKHYWKLAGFDTVSSTWTKISKLLDDYKDQQKKRNMTNKKSLEGRKRYEENLNKVFDISHPDLEKKLTEDRIKREGGREEVRGPTIP